MTNSPGTPFSKHFDGIEDPRRHNIRHLLHDILMIALCAVISGADSWSQVEEYGQSKFDWFKQFLELPNGIPSHDTFGHLFARIDPNEFQNFFIRWCNFARNIAFSGTQYQKFKIFKKNQYMPGNRLKYSVCLNS